MKISEMPAGRELDVLVAEKVLKWQPLPGPAKTMDKAFKERYWKKFNSYDPGKGYDFFRCLPKDTPWVAGCENRVPIYSKDIDRAMEIIKKTYGHWGWEITMDAHNGCRITLKAGSKKVYVEAYELPLAICRAGLLAMGVKEI